MRILLISLRTRILLLFPAAAAVLLGTMGFHVTAERQMRQEFVREQLQASAVTIATYTTASATTWSVAETEDANGVSALR